MCQWPPNGAVLRDLGGERLSKREGARFDTDEGSSEPRSSSSRITLNNGEESAAFLRLEIAFVIRLLEGAKMLLFRTRGLPLDPRAT